MSRKIIKDGNVGNKGAKKGLDAVSFWMFVTFGVVAIVMVLVLVYAFMHVEPPAPTHFIGKLVMSAPDFASFEAAASAEKAPTEKVEGTIGFDAFYKVTKERALKKLDNARVILGDDLYNAYKKGLDSAYYRQGVEYDYNDFINDIDEVIRQADLIEALYNYYAETHDMPAYEKCFEEDCSLLDFIETYTRDEIHDYLKERHDMWESLLLVEAKDKEIDDSYINLFYQDEICSEYDYIDKIQVELMTLTKDQYEMGVEAIQDAYDKGYIDTKILDESDIDALSELALYRDIDFYDEGFKELAVDTFNNYFASEVLSNSVYLGALATDSNASKEDQMKEMLDNVDTERQVPDKDWSAIENWHTEQFSLEERNADDVIYLLWKIVPGSVKHTGNIPTKESIYDDLLERSQYYIANSLISDTIYAEMNDLTEEEVHEMLKNNYGYSDEELDSLSEEELREELAKAESQQEDELQQNLMEISEHLIEDGYDISNLSDEEIIQLYIEKHSDMGVTDQN